MMCFQLFPDILKTKWQEVNHPMFFLPSRLQNTAPLLCCDHRDQGHYRTYAGQSALLAHRSTRSILRGSKSMRVGMYVWGYQASVPGNPCLRALAKKLMSFWRSGYGSPFWVICLLVCGVWLGISGVGVCGYREEFWALRTDFYTHRRKVFV